MAKWFSDTVRYIDDLLTLNNGNFEEEITNMYPPDISISIWSSKYGTVVYDKRDAFNLSIHCS